MRRCKMRYLEAWVSWVVHILLDTGSTLEPLVGAEKEARECEAVQFHVQVVLEASRSDRSTVFVQLPFAMGNLPSLRILGETLLTSCLRMSFAVGFATWRPKSHAPSLLHGWSNMWQHWKRKSHQKTKKCRNLKLVCSFGLIIGLMVSPFAAFRKSLNIFEYVSTRGIRSDSPLIEPCQCAGSIRCAHSSCVKLKLQKDPKFANSGKGCARYCGRDLIGDFLLRRFFEIWKVDLAILKQLTPVRSYWLAKAHWCCCTKRMASETKASSLWRVDLRNFNLAICWMTMNKTWISWNTCLIM